MHEKELIQANLQRAELKERLERLAADQRRTYEAIDRAKAEYHRLSGYIDALMELAAKKPLIVAEPPEKKPKAPDLRSDNPPRQQVADAALSLIRAAGKPLGRQELYDELTAKGLVIHGKDPVMVFSTMLWRERSRIARLRGFGYWPADKPYPPAQYFPATDQPSLL